MAPLPIPQGEIVRRGKVPLDHVLEPGVLGHGAVDDLLLRLRGEGPPGKVQAGQTEKAVVAVIILILGAGGQVLHQLIVPAHAHAVLHGDKVAQLLLIAVWAEHAVRVAVPHLQRVEEQGIPLGVHVQQKLGGVPDAGHRVKRVAAAQQREVGHRVQLKQVGAGDPEKVAHHQVGIPHRLQIRKAVEDIERVPPGLGDLVVDGHGERLKALVRVVLAHFHPGQVVQQGRMLGEADVEHPPPVGHRLPDKGPGEPLELLYAGYLPDHIVPQPDMVQRLVQPGITAVDLVKCRHGTASLRFVRYK